MRRSMVGQTLLNRFRVDAFIASGGMGTVFRVWDLRGNVSLAMKVLHAELADDPSMFKRFQREANALKKLAHPNIVPFYGLYHTAEQAFLLEAYIDGPTLKEILRQEGKALPLMETLICLKALCAALGYAHANKVVHCDVKPGNVMVAPGGTIYLTDFGIARHAESTTTTLAGAGAPAYMAPEQIRGLAVSPATDVYALGVMLFEMLTGQRPFHATEAGGDNSGLTTAERLRHAHLQTPAPDPRSLKADIPAELAKVALCALEKDPARRYRDASDFFAAVCAAVGVSVEQTPDRLSRLAESGTFFHSERSPNAAIPRQARKTEVTLFWGAAGIIALLGLFLIMKSSKGSLPQAPQPTKTQIVQTTIASSEEISILTSPLPQTPAIVPTRPPPTRITNTPRPTNPPPSRTPVKVCPGAIRSQIQVDMRAHVCTQSDRLITRSKPAPDGQDVFRLYPGTEFKVIYGPVCNDGSNWWQIRVKAGTTVHYGNNHTLTEDKVVWVREGSDAEDPYYICPP